MSGSFFRTATLLLIVTQSQPNLLKVQNMKSRISPDFYLALRSVLGKLGPDSCFLVGAQLSGALLIRFFWADSRAPDNCAPKHPRPYLTVKLTIRQIYFTPSLS